MPACVSVCDIMINLSKMHLFIFRMSATTILMGGWFIDHCLAIDSIYCKTHVCLEYHYYKDCSAACGNTCKLSSVTGLFDIHEEFVMDSHYKKKCVRSVSVEPERVVPESNCTEESNAMSSLQKVTVDIYY